MVFNAFVSLAGGYLRATDSQYSNLNVLLFQNRRFYYSRYPTASNSSNSLTGLLDMYKYYHSLNKKSHPHKSLKCLTYRSKTSSPWPVTDSDISSQDRYPG
ncbi:hypothetical protein NPIL_390001 [Nephila pilipes]|uniref:Uncharacterized protein n=1 Tax=Nephila pilipes TaxID=299642 RepID=A0A8X6UFL0_NEPPI|nr:hypothetical protein NPIL_390001 [Nephila pilipes]